MKMQICYLGRSVHRGIVTNTLAKLEFSSGRYHPLILRQGTQEGGLTDPLIVPIKLQMEIPQGAEVMGPGGGTPGFGPSFPTDFL